jgi:hypothetical protein
LFLKILNPHMHVSWTTRAPATGHGHANKFVITNNKTRMQLASVVCTSQYNFNRHIGFELIGKLINYQYITDKL